MYEILSASKLSPGLVKAMYSAGSGFAFGVGMESVNAVGAILRGQEIDPTGAAINIITSTLFATVSAIQSKYPPGSSEFKQAAEITRTQDVEGAKKFAEEHVAEIPSSTKQAEQSLNDRIVNDWNNPESSAIEVAGNGTKGYIESTGDQSDTGYLIDLDAAVNDFLSDSSADIAPKGAGDVKYYRIQTPAENGSIERIIVNDDGTIKITTPNASLNLSYGTPEHAQYFKTLKGGDSYVVEFAVDDWFHNFVQENAIPQRNYRSNPLNQGLTAPKIVDETTPGNSLEFPAIWNEWFEEYAKNGRILK